MPIILEALVPLPDIRLQSIEADGRTTLTVRYEIASGPVPAFDFVIYRSADTTYQQASDQMVDKVTISSDEELKSGLHTKTIEIGGWQRSRNNFPNYPCRTLRARARTP